MPTRSSTGIMAQYAASHQHPVNKALHVAGIPMMALSALLLFLSLEWGHLFPVALALLASGWLLQSIGHVFEGKAKEPLNEWRFPLVGLRWWLRRMRDFAERQV